jgi:glycosyltransferase involved in cell wall biosynthesis
MKIDVIIPAHDEAGAIAQVINDIPKELVSEIIVVDNASKDNTREIATNAGATVVTEAVPGYGKACLRGIQYLASKSGQPDIVVFLDGDYSDFPDKMQLLIDPIYEERAELVIGSRALGDLEPGSMTVPQIFGNWLATRLIRWFFGYHFTDLGPFRAIKYDELLRLNMQDEDFGWTVEMQVKAAKQGLKCLEVPVPYRKRIGQSKISGTIRGTILAGHKILWTIFKNI